MSLVFLASSFRTQVQRRATGFLRRQWCAAIVSVSGSYIYNIINALLISYRIRSRTLEYNYYTIYNIYILDRVILYYDCARARLTIK